MKLKSSKDFETNENHPSGKTMPRWLVFPGVLGIVFVAGAIFHVWLYILQVQNSYRLARLYEEHEQLLSVQRKLRLEWSRFRDPFDMEEQGLKQFGLAPPRQEQKVVMR